MQNGLVLERQEYTDKSIIGSFYYDGEFICYSLERPWLDNAQNVSCIPAGEYELEYHKYKNKIDTWALIGETVDHYPGDKQRNLILIHPANKPSELQGCIATGKKKGIDKMIDSRKGFNRLKNIIVSKSINYISII
jgi:hypothetical protein